MRHPAVRAAVTVAVLLSIAPVARADDAAELARQHYREGTKLYDLRRYRDAAHEYEAAYEAKDDPALLFNIAQAYRLAGDYEDSIASYRAFLRNAPDAANRSAVEARIAELQNLLAVQRKQNDVPPQGTLPPREPAPSAPAAVIAIPVATGPSDVDRARGRTFQRAAIGVFAGGVALAAAGAAFAALAHQAGEEVAGAPVFEPSTQARGKLDQSLAISGLAVGGVAIAGGVALWLFGRHVAVGRF
ncbi:MAG TPA: tetratricopeptide repeat protein [Polyangia bacterium]|jgi:tetratricopeptide (TPR) repeat protein